MEKTVRVSLLGKEYALRVDEEDEQMTLDMAAYVDTKLHAFKEAHPEQSDITAAVITALAVAEELFSLRETQDRATQILETHLSNLASTLETTLAQPAT